MDLKMNKHPYINRTLKSIRNEIYYDTLPEWRKFLWGWRTSNWSLKYLWAVYKLWKMTRK